MNEHGSNASVIKRKYFYTTRIFVTGQRSIVDTNPSRVPWQYRKMFLLQFRIIENKMGQKMESRVNHLSLIESFKDGDSQAQLTKSLNEPSLCDTLEKWLERTPGLTEDGFNFAQRYSDAIGQYLADEEATVQGETDHEKGKMLAAELKKQKTTFDTLVSEKVHNEKIRLKERRLSHKAFMGALMINCYSAEERFHLPHQLLTVS